MSPMSSCGLSRASALTVRVRPNSASPICQDPPFGVPSIRKRDSGWARKPRISSGDWASAMRATSPPIEWPTM